MFRGAPSLALLASVLTTGVAHAGVAEPGHFRGSPGERNVLDITVDGPTYVVKDGGATTVPGLGCTPEPGGGFRCTPPPRICGGTVECYEQLTIDLGDEDDQLILRGDPKEAHVAVNGQAGADRVDVRYTGARGGLVDGGDGNDTLLGGEGSDHLVGGNGADLVDGRGGFDSTSYYPRDVPVHVTLDRRAGDGAPGEGDDIRVESVTGGFAGDTLIGDDGPNALHGGGGPDILDGRGGDDRLTVGGYEFFGDQPIPSAGAQITCGAGDDRVAAFKGDTTDATCEASFFDGGPVNRFSTFALPSKSVKLDRLTARASRRGTVPFTVRRAPAERTDPPPEPLGGAFALQTPSRGAVSTSVPFRLLPGATAPVVVKLDARTRKRLKRTRSGITLHAVRDIAVRSFTDGTPYDSTLRLIAAVKVLPPR